MNQGDKKKIKLLLFIPNLACGGSEKYVSLLCNNINTDLFDITLAVLNNENPFYTINNPAIEIIDLGVKRVRNSLAAIRRTVRQKQPDIIFSISNHLNLYLAICRWLLPKKIKIVARESSIVSINNRRTSSPKIYNWLIKKFYRRIDCIICQSEYMQQDLIKNFNVIPGKIMMIHNAVEEITGYKTVNTSNVYKFITVARLSEEKGIDRLIRSVARLAIPFQYHIIGEGDKRASLQALIGQLDLKEKVFLSGQKKDPYAGMEEASLMLMGSHYEGFPNTLLEAGARGIPIVAFNAPGGIKEIIIEGENGLLVDDGNEKAFSAAIEKALQLKFDPDKIIATTKKRFCLKTAVAQVEELLIDLCHQH